MKKILLTAGFALFAWGSTCLAQSTYFSDSKEWLRKAEACKPELSYQIEHFKCKIVTTGVTL